MSKSELNKNQKGKKLKSINLEMYLSRDSSEKQLHANYESVHHRHPKKDSPIEVETVISQSRDNFLAELSNQLEAVPIDNYFIRQAKSRREVSAKAKKPTP